MKLDCEIKTSAALLRRSLTNLVPRRDIEDAMLILAPARTGCRIEIIAPRFSAATTFSAAGHWRRRVGIALPRVLLGLKSFGRSNLTIVYANGWLCLNSLRLDAMDLTVSTPKRSVAPRRRGVQLELPGTRGAARDLFDFDNVAAPPTPLQGSLDLGEPRQRC